MNIHLITGGVLSKTNIKKYAFGVFSNGQINLKLFYVQLFSTGNILIH